MTREQAQIKMNDRAAYIKELRKFELERGYAVHGGYMTGAQKAACIGRATKMFNKVERLANGG